MLKSMTNTKFFRNVFLASALTLGMGAAPAHAGALWDAVSSIDWAAINEFLEALGHLADGATLLMGGEIDYFDF